MDNEITINGEVYVKKNQKLVTHEQQEDGSWISDEEKPWPQEGDEYWYFDSSIGMINWGNFDKNVPYRDLQRIGNFFQTKEEAQMYSLRIESLSKGFMPVIGSEEIWMWDFCRKSPVKYDNKRYILLAPSIFVIPQFPTKEECQEWYDKFGSSWLYLFDKKS